MNLLIPSTAKRCVVLLVLPLLIILSCKPAEKEIKTIGTLERLDPALDAIISENAQIEIIGEGYEWSEGPVWVDKHQMLLFSDVPTNTIHKWTEANGAEVYLTPSGYTGTEPSASSEPGSNGLLLDKDGRLVLCQHGDRRVAVMNAPLDKPEPAFTSITDNYQGMRFNSPNDAAYRRDGELFFTDPPYGLPKRAEDPSKETPFHGVYKVNAQGETILLLDSITRPNGIDLTRDGKTMIIANSDPDKAVWYEYQLNENDSIISGRIFYDATNETKTELGLPDGFKIDKNGNIFASGPGGVWIFDSSGKVLGRIRLPDAATSNCALANDEKTLFITNDMYLLRVKMRQ